MVDESTEVDEETRECHTLGTHLEGEDLDGVEGLERSPSERVDSLEDVDHGNNGKGSRVVGDILLLHSAGNNDTNPADRTSNVNPNEERSSANLIDSGGTNSRDDTLNSVHGDEQVGSGGSIRDTSVLEDRGQVVRDNTVTSPLTEESSDTVGGKTIAGGTVLEERAVIPPSLVGTLELQVRLVLEHLKFDPFGIWVAVAVVLGKEGFGLLLLSVAVVPSWRLWEEEGQNKDKSWEQSLKPERNDP